MSYENICFVNEMCTRREVNKTCQTVNYITKVVCNDKEFSFRIIFIEIKYLY